MKVSYTAHDWLKRFYNFILLQTEIGKPAKEYLMKRGISEDAMKEFKIGFAPRNVKYVLKFLKGKQFSYRQLVERKVLHRYQDGKLTDPFRNRIVFPIQDYQGRTVAFGGRTLDNNNKIKYYNSPETKIFEKSDNLYGFDLAANDIKEKQYAILLEGYFDVVSAHQHGIKNSVATLGTALTVNQALLIKSVTKNVVITFDGDDAGMNASFQSASILESVGCNVKISYIKHNLDPDDYLKKYSADSFINEVILNAKTHRDTFVQYKTKDYNISSINDRFSYVNDILNEISSNDIEVQIKLLQTLDSTLNVSIDTMYEAVRGK